LIFKDPALHQEFQKQKLRYDLHENDPADNGYRLYFEKFLDFVLPRVKSINRVLDFGSGKSTLLADMLEFRGVECDSYDPIYHPDTAFRARKYDLITSVEVFEHLHNPKKIVAELLGLLNEGGYLAIRTEFHAGIESFSDWYYPKDPTHILFYTPKTFAVLCEVPRFRCITHNNKNMILLQRGAR
jgi:SAM-dependent methyltransferase